jgi:hypothetical protein
MLYAQSPATTALAQVALDIEGASAGRLEAAYGGEPMADVVEETTGSGPISRKHLGSVRYSNAELTCGVGMAPQFYDWISQTLDGSFVRRNCAIVTSDANAREITRLTMSSALVAQVGFPLLDASSKDPATMSVQLAPSSSVYSSGSGFPVAALSTAGQQKRWLPSNFRLRIDGLDSSHVHRIEPIVVTTTMVDTSVGETRTSTTQPGRLHFSDLVVTLSEGAGADTYRAWAQGFMIGGHNDSSDEKSGTLELLASDLSETLFTLTFSGLGIASLSTTPADPQMVLSVTARLYFQQVRFSVGAPSSSPVVVHPSTTAPQTSVSPVVSVAAHGGLIAPVATPDNLVRVQSP